MPKYRLSQDLLQYHISEMIWQSDSCHAISAIVFIDKSNYHLETRHGQAECKLHSSRFESTTK